MRIIKRSTLAAYWRRYPAAETSLRQWVSVTKAARWRNIMDVRQTYTHADAAIVESGNTVTIVNVNGNHFRLVVSIKYGAGTVYIRDFMTHAAYGDQRWKARH